MTTLVGRTTNPTALADADLGQRPGDGERAPLINARSVAWALSMLAVCSLAAGVLAVEYLGRTSGKTQLEEDPVRVTPQPRQERERPTVLPPMSASPSRAPDGLGEFDSLFSAPPQERPSAVQLPLPTGDTAALPADPRYQ